MTFYGRVPAVYDIVGRGGVFLYATSRRLPLALDGLTIALVALTVVSPRTIDLTGLVAPQPLPSLLAVALQVATGVQRREGWRCLFAPLGILVVSAHEVPSGASTGLLGFHLVLAAIFVLGAVFDDPFGRFLRFFPPAWHVSPAS